jgi:hypothetical protein
MSEVTAPVARRLLPAVYWEQKFFESGGLVVYGVDRIDLYRRALTEFYAVKKLVNCRSGNQQNIN